MVLVLMLVLVPELELIMVLVAAVVALMESWQKRKREKFFISGTG